MDTIIRADHVSMCFRMDTTRTTNLKEWFVKWVKRQQKYEKFYALKDVNLAVGDPAFQRKSFDRMIQIIRGGTTVLFVSHNMAQIRELCTKVLWLDHGQIVEIGPTQEVCDRYEAAMAQG